MVDSVLPASQTIDSLNLWCKILLRGMQEAEFDLSTRQTAILLSVYLGEEAQSVKTLSENLGFSKAAICRAVDVLCQYGLLKRRRDDADKRQVTLTKTIKGMVFLSDMADIIRDETNEKESVGA